MTDQNLLLQEGGYPNAPADIKQALRDVRNHAALAHIEQMERRIVELSEELDTERVRLAACGVAAMANTRASMAERITGDNPYWSASYGDVCRAVDKQIAYREQIESQPSAEALVQAALEAAALACDEISGVWGRFSDPSRSLLADQCAQTIRALSAQQIIESCKGEKS